MTVPPNVAAGLNQLQIELPSWAFGNSGTRFKVFPQAGVPRDAYEKVSDAATVHRFTGVAPSVAIHIPWDKVDDFADLRRHAEAEGVTIGAVNPNVFQENEYMLGSVCNPDPGVRRKATDHLLECIEIAETTGSTILSLWQGSWVAAFAVGALTWGLILWPVIAHRRKRGETGLPAQTRYNLPIEVLYTVVPFIAVAVFFYFTARDEDRILETSANPDHKITVTGIQWSWQFTYTSDGGAQTTGTPGKPPTLVLPEGESVQFRLVSDDVITRSGCRRSCSRWT